MNQSQEDVSVPKVEWVISVNECVIGAIMVLAARKSAIVAHFYVIQ